MTSSPSLTTTTEAFNRSSHHPLPNQSQRTSEARAAFTATLNSIGTSLDSDLQARALDIHSNSTAIAKQEADVLKQGAGLKKESDRYQKVADESRGKLKEIGDIQNWAEILERDLLVLEETVRLGEGERREGRKTGGHGRGERANGWH